MNPIQAIRGMNDILPAETYCWQFVESICRDVLQSFGYHEIRLPIVEKTDLFKRSIGDATDIVEKEMYSFIDRNEDSLTLRPEGTAGCVRAGVEHGLLYNQIQRLWYMGPYFRHERPQKGRYRQFHQCGAEAFGIETPDIDAEMIFLAATLFERLGLKSSVTLQINSLGSREARNTYRNILHEYLVKHQNDLDEDSKRRLNSNPLRILDSKNPDMQSLIKNAPVLSNYLDKDSQKHFETLQHYLKSIGLHFTINPCLVRGLDYYTKTVFEWVTDELGAQGTVCAGGRYDNLVGELGGKPTPALGFAVGLERTILLVQKIQQNLQRKPIDVYFITDGESSFARGLELAGVLRKTIPHLSVLSHCGNGSIKNQMKKADKSGAVFALILGEDELKNNTITLKYLRQNTSQELIKQEDLCAALLKYCQK